VAYFGNQPADVALKVGSGVITATEIQDASIITADIANDAITANKIDEDGTGFQMGTLGVGGAVSGSDKLTVTGDGRFTGTVRIPHDTTDALRIGASDDLELWHNGTDSAVTNANTGKLYLWNYANSDTVIGSNNVESAVFSSANTTLRGTLNVAGASTFANHVTIDGATHPILKLVGDSSGESTHIQLHRSNGQGFTIYDDTASLRFRADLSGSNPQMLQLTGSDQSATFYGTVRSTNVFYANDNGASNPGYRFFNAASGMYHAGSDSVGFAVTGNNVLTLNAASAVFAQGIHIQANEPSLNFKDLNHSTNTYSMINCNSSSGSMEIQADVSNNYDNTAISLHLDAEEVLKMQRVNSSSDTESTFGTSSDNNNLRIHGNLRMNSANSISFQNANADETVSLWNGGGSQRTLLYASGGLRLTGTTNSATSGKGRGQIQATGNTALSASSSWTSVRTLMGDYQSGILIFHVQDTGNAANTRCQIYAFNADYYERTVNSIDNVPGVTAPGGIEVQIVRDDGSTTSDGGGPYTIQCRPANGTSSLGVRLLILTAGA